MLVGLVIAVLEFLVLKGVEFFVVVLLDIGISLKERFALADQMLAATLAITWLRNGFGLIRFFGFTCSPLESNKDKQTKGYEKNERNHRMAFSSTLSSSKTRLSMMKF